MSSKRTLVKQKVTYGSAGDGNLHESDEDFSGKRSLTKRVSFDSHELSDSDSDAENSLGRINRSSAGPAGGSLDGLFRESSPKDRQRSEESIKGTSIERQGSQDKHSRHEDKGKFLFLLTKLHHSAFLCYTTKVCLDANGPNAPFNVKPVGGRGVGAQLPRY